MSSDVHINLRAEKSARDLIDEAARVSGVTRTDFMMSAALRDAQDLLLDRSSIVLSPEDFADLMDQLDRGVVGDTGRAKDLLKRPKAWD